jgi:hypothetical protein
MGGHTSHRHKISDRFVSRCFQGAADGDQEPFRSPPFFMSSSGTKSTMKSSAIGFAVALLFPALAARAQVPFDDEALTPLVVPLESQDAGADSPARSDEFETATVTAAADAISSTGECAPSGCNCGKDRWTDWINDDRPLLHELRDRPLFGNFKYSVGGQLRFRSMDERNRLRPAGNLRRDTYNLWRFTPFLEAGNDTITGFVQAIDASIFNEDIPPVPIDANRADLLKYYVDLNLIDLSGAPLRIRYGRQFLKYGKEHLVSPLAWSNTYRNFEGFRLYHAGSSWDIDGFAVQPVNPAAGNTYRPTSFDTPDQSVWFSGVYATYKRLPTGPVDVYWLWLDEKEPKNLRHDGSRHTVGLHWAGTLPVRDECDSVLRTYLWDLEGAYQFGKDNFNGIANQDVNAGFVSAIGGVTFNQVPWSPTLKGLFWWGSGDDNPTDGEINTVTTLFPLGHAYWGLIDNFNGANLLDYSVQASVKPAEKWDFLAAWHWFDKAQTNDFTYNIANAPLGPTGTPRHLGNELDLVATYTVNANLNVQAGYFWFWYGNAITQTPLARKDAQQFYLQVTWDY